MHSACSAKAEDLEIVAEHLGHAKYCCDPELDFPNATAVTLWNTNP